MSVHIKEGELYDCNSEKKVTMWKQFKRNMKEYDKLSPRIYEKIHFNNRAGRTFAGGIVSTLMSAFMVFFVVSTCYDVTHRRWPYVTTSKKFLLSERRLLESNE